MRRAGRSTPAGDRGSRFPCGVPPPLVSAHPATGAASADTGAKGGAASGGAAADDVGEEGQQAGGGAAPGELGRPGARRRAQASPAGVVAEQCGERGSERGAESGQRTRILDAALGLVSELGSAGMSMRRLAAACGLNVATIYHYFPSKAALLRALVAEQRYGERLAVDEPPADPALPARARFGAFLAWVAGRAAAAARCSLRAEGAHRRRRSANWQARHRCRAIGSTPPPRGRGCGPAEAET